MSFTERKDIPSGYKIVVCTGINATFPMPETWFFKAESQEDTQAYFMTREAIVPNGLFATGLSLNMLPGIRRKAGISPSEMGRRYMQTQSEMTPTSRITTSRDGSLVTYRRYFSSGSRLLAGRPMPPTSYYTEFSANDQTDKAYIVIFESPSAKWAEDAPIAQVMIENRVLDPVF